MEPIQPLDLKKPDCDHRGHQCGYLEPSTGELGEKLNELVERVNYLQEQLTYNYLPKTGIYCPHCNRHIGGTGSEKDRRCGYCGKAVYNCMPGSPVHQENGKWYFWDETWADREGPFDTVDEAHTQLQIYFERLNRPKA